MYLKNLGTIADIVDIYINNITIKFLNSVNVRDISM